MRLVYEAEGVEIPIEENQVSVLCIESPKVLAKMASDMWMQYEGKDGGWILADRDKSLDIAKEAECIFNPFEVDTNSTKAVSKMQKMLLGTAMERFSTETGILNNKILEYLEQLAATEDHFLEFDFELDVASLLKSYHVRFTDDADSLAEQIIEHAKVMRRIMNKSMMVFLNLKQFVTPEELQQLYKGLLYEKLRVLLIEGTDTKDELNENKVIVDSDHCIITIESKN